MEYSTFRSQNLFKRLLLYHWFRQGKNYFEAHYQMCHDYGPHCIPSETLVKKLFEYLNDWERFNFDVYCSTDLAELGPTFVPTHQQAQPQPFHGFYNPLQPLPTHQSSHSFQFPQQSSSALISSISLAHSFDHQIDEQPPPTVDPVPPQPNPIANISPQIDPNASQNPNSNHSTEPDEYSDLHKIVHDPSMSEAGKKKLLFRHLMLQCFKFKFTGYKCFHFLKDKVPECLSLEVSITTVNKWYRRFKTQGTDIHDKPRPGAPPKLTDAEIDEYMMAHPNALPRHLAKHFKRTHSLTASTMARRLMDIGYVRKFDRYEKTDQKTSEPLLSDEALIEYKFANPSARAIEIGRHFNVPASGLNERLIAMGFNVPRYVTKFRKPRKKQKDSEEEDQSTQESSNDDDSTDEESSLPQPTKPTHGRPKGCKNIQYKGMLLSPVTGEPVTSLEEAKRIALSRGPSLDLVAKRGKQKQIKDPPDDAQPTSNIDLKSFIELLESITPESVPETLPKADSKIYDDRSEADEPVTSSGHALRTNDPEMLSILAELDESSKSKASSKKSLPKTHFKMKKITIDEYPLKEVQPDPPKRSRKSFYEKRMLQLAAQQTLTTTIAKVKEDPSPIISNLMQCTDLPEDIATPDPSALTFDPLANLDLMNPFGDDSEPSRSTKRKSNIIVLPTTKKKIKEEP